MSYNGGKLIVIAVLALALIAAIVFGDETAQNWAVPLLTMLVGYIIGNAAVTSQQGAVRPVAYRELPPPPVD